MKALILTLTAAVGLSGCGLSDRIATTRAYNYATVTHASKHVNASKEFNEVNPGIGIGSEAPVARTRWSLGVEAGRFRNSSEELTTYLTGYGEFDVLRNKPRALRIGGFSGLAQYPAEADKNRSEGKFAIGDFIPVVGMQVTVPTFGPHEFRMRITPGLERSDAIVTLQSNFVF